MYRGFPIIRKYFRSVLHTLFFQTPVKTIETIKKKLRYELSYKLFKTWCGMKKVGINLLFLPQV